MIVRKDGRESFLAIGEGLVLVTGDRVAIVTDMAVPAERIDEANAEEARQRAAARLRDKISDEEVATVNASWPAPSPSCRSSAAGASERDQTAAQMRPSAIDGRRRRRLAGGAPRMVTCAASGRHRRTGM